MSQGEAALLVQLNLLAAAVVILVLSLAVAIGAVTAYAGSWHRVTVAFVELRAWYRGHQQQGTVELLVRSQAERDMSRRQSQGQLPSGPRQRATEAKTLAAVSSKPQPLDQTWPSGAVAAKPASVRLASEPPALPEPVAAGDEPPSDWSDSELVTESMLVDSDAAPSPANDAEPMPLVQQLADKQTWVWPQRKLPRVD